MPASCSMLAQRAFGWQEASLCKKGGSGASAVMQLVEVPAIMSWPLASDLPPANAPDTAPHGRPTSSWLHPDPAWPFGEWIGRWKSSLSGTWSLSLFVIVSFKKILKKKKNMKKRGDPDHDWTYSQKLLCLWVEQGEAHFHLPQGVRAAGGRNQLAALTFFSHHKSIAHLLCALC